MTSPTFSHSSENSFKPDKKSEKRLQVHSEDRGDISGNGKLREAPTFYPTDDEFKDPLEYIEKIRREVCMFINGLLL